MIPERARLLSDVDVIQEGMVCCDRALAHKGNAVGPAVVLLEETVPCKMRQEYVAKQIGTYNLPVLQMTKYLIKARKRKEGNKAHDTSAPQHAIVRQGIDHVN